MCLFVYLFIYLSVGVMRFAPLFKYTTKTREKVCVNSFLTLPTTFKRVDIYFVFYSFTFTDNIDNPKGWMQRKNLDVFLDR